MKILYPTLTLRRYENGWTYSIEKIYGETSGVHVDGSPLILRFYAQCPPGEEGRTFKLTLEEEGR